MRTQFRRLAILFAAGSLLCFGACERHKPEELHHGGHAAHDTTEHTANAPAVHDEKTHAAAPAEHSAAHVSPTPAQFFPSATPTP